MSFFATNESKNKFFLPRLREKKAGQGNIFFLSNDDKTFWAGIFTQKPLQYRNNTPNIIYLSSLSLIMFQSLKWRLIQSFIHSHSKIKLRRSYLTVATHIQNGVKRRRERNIIIVISVSFVLYYTLFYYLYFICTIFLLRNIILTWKFITLLERALNSGSDPRNYIAWLIRYVMFNCLNLIFNNFA